MRDPNRIDEFLKKFGEYWKERIPDWRFGQIICNLQRFEGRDLFFCEEDQFLELMKKYFS